MTQATSHRGMRFHLLCSKPIKPIEAAKVARVLADLELDYTLWSDRGSNEREIVVLPEMHFRVGGFDATLRPAREYSKPVGNEFQYGHFGMDVLSQAREVRLDFVFMTLDLLP